MDIKPRKLEQLLALELECILGSSASMPDPTDRLRAVAIVEHVLYKNDYQLKPTAARSLVNFFRDVFRECGPCGYPQDIEVWVQTGLINMDKPHHDFIYKAHFKWRKVWIKFDSVRLPKYKAPNPRHYAPQAIINLKHLIENWSRFPLMESRVVERFMVELYSKANNLTRLPFKEDCPLFEISPQITKKYSHLLPCD